MPEADLELVKLRKVYPGGTVAVEDFDLRVARGEFISFVGPSGCGKTTTLRMIAGLESITGGDLLIRGRNFTDVPAEKRPTATIFQNYAVFPHMTVWENVAFGLRVRRLPSAEIKRRVDAIIEKFELGSVAGARESALAGGQKQRVALARGLVTEPDILLLDEPLGALDANLRKAIQEELKLLQRNLGLTFVFVTHAQSEALSMGDRVVVMNAGRVEQISAPFALYSRPKSPFVARFIGRNNMIDGRLKAAADGHAIVATRFGDLTGTPSFDAASVRDGAAAFAVVPSEYVAIRAASHGEPIHGPESGDVQSADSERAGVAGTCLALDAVGQIVHVTVRLDDTLTVRLETHREALSGRAIAPGAPVRLSWRPENVTIVADAA